MCECILYRLLYNDLDYIMHVQYARPVWNILQCWAYNIFVMIAHAKPILVENALNPEGLELYKAV